MSHTWGQKRAQERLAREAVESDKTMELLRQANIALLAGDVDGYRRAMASVRMPTDAEVLAALRQAPAETDDYDYDGDDPETVAFRERADGINALVDYVRSTPADQIDRDYVRSERARLRLDEAPR
jgi:hypothetical protein